MEAVTELRLCNQIISSIKTQERVSLFIYFGFGLGRGREEKWPPRTIHQTPLPPFILLPSTAQGVQSSGDSCTPAETRRSTGKNREKRSHR